MPRSLDVNKLADAVLIHATVYIFYCTHETDTLLVRVGEIDETLLSLDFSNCVLRWSLLGSRGVSESVRKCVRRCIRRSVYRSVMRSVIRSEMRSVKRIVRLNIK